MSMIALKQHKLICRAFISELLIETFKSMSKAPISLELSFGVQSPTVKFFKLFFFFVFCFYPLSHSRFG